MQVGARMTLYRFHLQDPVFFKKDLRVTMQALGWRDLGLPKARYHALQDDIASVAYWYQTLPGAPLAALPDRDARDTGARDRVRDPPGPRQCSSTAPEPAIRNPGAPGQATAQRAAPAPGDRPPQWTTPSRPSRRWRG